MAEELYATCKFLWERIIMDDPVSKARKRGGRKLESNVLLGELDIFITKILGYEYYGRYVDDFYIMVTEEEYPQLKRDIKLIENFLKNRLNLTLRPTKRYCQSVYKGMPYLGARIYPRCLYPSDRLQAKFRKAIYDYDRSKGSIDTVISYFGHVRHMDADEFVRKVFREVGWNYDILTD